MSKREMMRPMKEILKDVEEFVILDMQDHFKTLLYDSLILYLQKILRNENQNFSVLNLLRAAHILREFNSDEAAKKAKEVVECMANNEEQIMYLIELMDLLLNKVILDFFDKPENETQIDDQVDGWKNIEEIKETFFIDYRDAYCEIYGKILELDPVPNIDSSDDSDTLV